MKTTNLNFFKKSIVIILALVLVLANGAMVPVNAQATDVTMNEELTMYNARYNRIISSDSIVDKTGTYTGNDFTTATYNGSLHHGMSYFVDCQTPNVTFTIKIYIAGTSKTVYTGSLAQDDYEATNTFYLNGNSNYYIQVIPSKTYAVYDFAYNIYYDTVNLNNN